jgi:hypothetical protein
MAIFDSWEPMGQPGEVMKKITHLLTTDEKAKEINFSSKHYGTFAEIGAGQEVARWFFQAGGAAGTVAKSMSAYDMTFSNAIYGTAHRFVSRERLKEMLDHEYRLLLERLGQERGDRTRFFVFADTVAARSHKYTGDGKGWMGIRFQTEPSAAPGNIVIHVRLKDDTNAEQMEVLGILGVNLVHAAFCHWRNPSEILNRLMDGIRPGRVEVDMVDFRGTIFNGVDNRLMSLKMVHSNLTPVALFSAAGVNLEAEDCFYGKSILLLRGHYRPITNFHLTMMEKASTMFRNDPANKGKEIVEVNEITMRNLVRHRKAGMEDFLDRVDCLGALKKTVLVTGIFRFHRLAEYLTQRTKGSVGFVIGVPLLSKILDEDFYNDLPGGILEGMGRLFLPGVKLFVHPGYDPLSGMYVSGHTLTVRKPAEDLHRYLVSKGRIVDLAGAEKDLPPCSSSEILRNIRNAKVGWEKNVPSAVASLIRRRRLFGYRASK